MSTFKSIKSAFQITDMVINSYVSDLDDAQLMARPGKGCNHLAWQLGHLIASEGNLINMMKEDTALQLPDGFADKHSKETVGSDDASAFATKDEYIELYKQSRENSLKVLEGLSEEQFAADPPEMFKGFCADMGGVAMLIATHPMMHAGQFVPVRREFDKPVVI